MKKRFSGFLAVSLIFFNWTYLLHAGSAEIKTVGANSPKEEADPRCMADMKEREKKAGAFIKTAEKNTKQEADPRCMADMKEREARAAEYLKSGDKKVQESTQAVKDKEKALFTKIDTATLDFKEKEKKGKEIWEKTGQQVKERETAARRNMYTVGAAEKK